MRYIFIILIALLILMPLASALPTTGAATLVGSNNVTLTMTGAAGTSCRFEWGLNPGPGKAWKTPNQTPAGGVCTATIRGSPLIGHQKFYYRACDSSGCGADAFFTTADVTPMPTTTYGEIFTNLTNNGFDITLIGLFTIAPYVWVIPTFPGLIWGLLLTGLLIGWWLRGRDLGYVAIAGFIMSPLFFGSAYGLGIPLDPVLVGFGQGVFYAAIAGTILHLIKK